MRRIVSVIIPAHNEARFISRCLEALMAAEALPEGWQARVVVVANGCDDDTAALARQHERAALARRWQLNVLDLPEGSKPAALQAGDDASNGDVRVYLDADVMLDPSFLAEIVTALMTELPHYASGKPRLQAASTAITRAYGRLWMTLPFLTRDVPGFGVFAVNRAGRGRWGHWPQIISDDTFARLNFAPQERTLIASGYSWPLVEGFANLVRVRRRQDQGVAQVNALFPGLAANDDKPRIGLPGLIRRAARDPIGMAVYVAVALTVRSPFFGLRSGWDRGR